MRFLKLSVLTVVVTALFAFVPSAFASTMTESNGVPTWTAATGIANDTTFTDDATSITIQTADDPVDNPTNATNVTASCVDSDGNNTDGVASQVTCTGVSTLIANSEDIGDVEDASSMTFHPITINGGDGDDYLFGGSQNDTLNGEAGDDSVYGEGGADTINGGDGGDNLYGSCNCPPTGDGGDTITGGDGNDFAEGGPGDDNIDLGAGDDSAGGGPGNDTINGGDGDDNTLKGGPGADTINGGNGDDRLAGDCDGFCNAGSPGNDTLNGGAGNDFAQGEGGNDNIDMGAGDDTAYGDCQGNGGTNCHGGTPGDDVINGGDGVDDLHGQRGNDTVDGGAGNDDLVQGGPDNDTVRGGDGNDDVEGGPGADSVDGGAGDDYIDASDFGDAVTQFAPDTIHGGSGYDYVTWDTGCSINDQVTISLDDQPNDSYVGGPGGCTGEDDPGNNFASDIEALNVESGSTPVNATGSGGANQIYVNGFNGDTVDPGPGPDSVQTNSGPDTVNAVDGYPDFIDCGPGTDTANVDQFDTTVNCENVNVTSVASAYQSPASPATPEDKPPAVQWLAPTNGTTLSANKHSTFQAKATDDHGVSKVVFQVGTRTICTVTAPSSGSTYSCDYAPTAADVGKNILIVTAYDTAGQTSTAIETMNLTRFDARSISAKTTPKTDTSFPFVFTTSGRLSLPSGVPASAGCVGRVQVQFRTAKKTISSRKVALRRDCTYSSKVKFRIPSRLHPKSLEVLVRWLGNAVVNPKKGPTGHVAV